MDFYYSQPRLTGLGQRHAFIMRGYGDYIVRNCTSSIYSEISMNSNTFTRFGSNPVDMNIDKYFLTLIENTIITNQDFNTSATLIDDPSHGTLSNSPVMNMNVTYSNYTIVDVYSSGSKGLFEDWLNNRTIITMRDVTIQNVITNKFLVEVEDAREVVIDNFRVINVTIYNSHLFGITGAGNVDIDTLVFSSIILEGRYALDFAVIVSFNFIIY